VTTSVQQNVSLKSFRTLILRRVELCSETDGAAGRDLEGSLIGRGGGGMFVKGRRMSF
jgi:hypothetical protein